MLAFDLIRLHLDHGLDCQTPVAGVFSVGFQYSYPYDYLCIYSAASWSPLTWVQQALAPKKREDVSEAEIAAARKAAAEKGQLSVFEILSEVEAADKGTYTRQKKHDHVRLTISSVTADIQSSVCSINIPPPTSRYRIES